LSPFNPFIRFTTDYWLNLFSSVECDRADLDSSIVQDNSSYATFFKVVASIVAVVLIAYLTVVLIMLINKCVEKLGVKFE